jgi:hypothetical protein
MRTWLAVLALAALTACASANAPRAPSGPATPAGSIELGDFRRASADSLNGRFARTVAERYAAGAALATVSADLTRNNFACQPGPTGRGDPPDRICRRTVREPQCVHTWQVMLYADGQGARLSRTRGTYDRACRDDDDGLLGGN